MTEDFINSYDKLLPHHERFTSEIGIHCEERDHMQVGNIPFVSRKSEMNTSGVVVVVSP